MYELNVYHLYNIVKFIDLNLLHADFMHIKIMKNKLQEDLHTSSLDMFWSIYEYSAVTDILFNMVPTWKEAGSAFLFVLYWEILALQISSLEPHLPPH